jgi:UDPglucose--hexose-1-phosphate uridylyltransferase
MTDVSWGGLDTEAPHRRQNLLTGEWVLVSPHRTKRPWQGREEDAPTGEERPGYDPGCYLCPGNGRAGGAQNPEYTGVYVFGNDFAALKPDSPESAVEIGGLLRAESESGVCRVICFSPRHDLTLPEMETPAIRAVVDEWARQYGELGGRDGINHVQIFENRGKIMGASNPHPHGQIWAQRTIPGEPARETARQAGHHEAHGRSLLGDYLELELEREERLVVQNDHFVALVPFWAVWPFETLVIGREHRRSLLDLQDAERDGLADIVKRLTTRYDNLFRTSFPYSAGLHQAPTDGEQHPEWHLHMHFYPPLLRSATIKKFMVGYEMLGEPQRDITAEASAERLRELSDTHYSLESESEAAPGTGSEAG